jgi:hypothetical protein
MVCSKCFDLYNSSGGQNNNHFVVISQLLGSGAGFGQHLTSKEEKFFVKGHIKEDELYRKYTLSFSFFILLLLLFLSLKSMIKCLT